MKKLPAVHPDDVMKVMEKLTEELQPVLRSSSDPQLIEAENIFLGTLCRLTFHIFSWLPPEQQSELLTTCGTWFDIGMIMGRSPMRLVDIIRTVEPRLIETNIPDWLANRASSD